MKIPIYTQVKAKLESKGIDSITSGQIAWFIASVIISFIFCTLFIVSGNILENTLNNFFDILFNRAFDFLRFASIFIFILNFLYPYNTAPLMLGSVIASVPIFVEIHFNIVNILSLATFLLMFSIKKTKILGFLIVCYFAIIFTWNFWKLIYSLAR